MTKEKVKGFLSSLVLTYVLVLMFCVTGLISVTNDISWARYVVPVLVALIVSIVMYAAGWVMWVALVAIGNSFWGIALLLAFAGIGALCLTVVKFVLPEAWMTFSGNILALALMGFAFAIAASISNSDIMQMLSIESRR